MLKNDTGAPWPDDEQVEAPTFLRAPLRITEGAVTGNEASKTRGKMLCSVHVTGTYSWSKTSGAGGGS